MSWDPQWSVEAWLETLGLADYIDQFIDNGYDLQELCANLKGEDLDAIGVHSELHRKRIFAESSVLKDEATARFKKSNGGGSAGSTDHSGSMGSHGSFQATEPVSDEVSKHLYSEVWIGEQATVEGNGMPSALTQLMQNGGHGDTSGVDNKKKGPSGPPPKAPRKKGRTVTKPNYSTQTSLPALPPPRHLQPSGSSGSLNKVQLKLKVLEELQKDRIILSESPYCKEDGSMDKEKLSELCQTYSERFNIDPAQIMDTVSMICKATETKRGHDETDTSSQKTPVESSSNIYEEPADMMSNALTTFKESSPPSKPKRSKAPTVPAHGAEDVETEAVNTNPKHSPPLKKGKKKKGNAVLLQKPGSSSSDNSPEQERRVSPRTSPQPSPVTSPKEHKILGLFSKKKDKKAAQGLTVGDVNSPKQGKGGKAVLLPGKPEMKKSPEDTPTASPSLPLASKKRGGRGTLTNVPPPLTSLPSREPSNAVKHRTTSVSSASTTESESSPLAPKKFGILRFSARWGSQHHKAKTKRGKNNYQKSLTASDFELNKVGLKTDEEKKQELCLSRSHEELFDSRIAQNSPTISKKGSKHRGGGFFKLFKRMTVMTKGKEVGEREKGPTEDGEGSADEAETHENKGTFVSYIPSSFSMPNIASAAVKVTSEGSATTPKYHSVGIRVLVDKSAPSTPSYLHVQSPKSPVPLSPDPSPLLHRKVMQSEATPSNDHLIPIQNTDGGREGEMSSWQPHSPSHMMVQPTESFDSDVFSGINHENVCSFEDKRTSLGSCSDTVSDSSSVTSKNVPAAGSRASYGSVSGSYTSSASNASAATAPTSSRTASNASTATTRSLGSTQKPPPPPKPKSLDRSLLRSRGTTPPHKKQTTKDEDTASRGSSDIERVIPPPKPPQPLRGSVKKTETQRVEGENRGEERREGGEVKPPPKPPRRNRSMKAVGSEKRELTPQRKSQTLLPQSRSGSSASSTSVDSAPPGSVPYKPTPKPRSGTNVSVLQNQTVSTEASTLEENISAKLSEENIDLTLTPYSTVPSPVTSPKEHKIFGLFSKKDKKTAQGLTVGDVNCIPQREDCVTCSHEAHFKDIPLREDCVIWSHETHFEDIPLREDCLTYSDETQIFLPTSGPPIDPDNTREYIPACFSPVATLSQCTPDGRWYYDEHNDFGLEISAGAIPEGESITIDIGVALYGPFQYPEGLRPVSPVFWVCVRGQKDFQFLKPVKITIPHCLNLQNHDDIELLGLTFLKGDHAMNPQQMYEFQQAEGDVLIEPFKKYGIIKTTHFCSHCVSSKYTKMFIEKAAFCLLAAIPNEISTTATAYFFVTFLLGTCLDVVKEEISNDPTIKGHTQQTGEFEFDGKKELMILLPEPQPNNWEIGLTFRNKISFSDIDFFDKTLEDLKLREERRMYPPRFCVTIACSSPTARPHLARIKFTGTVNDFAFDMSLNPLPTSPTSIGSGCSSRSIHEQDGDDPPSLPDLLRLKIPQEVGAHYKTFGIFLLNDETGSRVDAIKKASLNETVINILQEWITGRGKPRTWQALIETLNDSELTDLADKIQRKIEM